MDNLKVLIGCLSKSIYKIKSIINTNDSFRYWDKLYNKYYEKYGGLSRKDLRRLLSIKSVDYHVNLSYPWMIIFLSAILGAFISNIINVINFLSTDISINLDQSIIGLIGWGILGIATLVPLFGYSYLFIKGISFPKTSVFYILWVAVVVLAQFAKKASFESFVNNGIVLLAFLNLYLVMVTILDIRKQRLGLECSVIKDILIERENM